MNLSKTYNLLAALNTANAYRETNDKDSHILIMELLEERNKINQWVGWENPMRIAVDEFIREAPKVKND